MKRDVCIYHIKVRNQVDEYTFNASSPQQIEVAQENAEVTVLTLRADQSGLIGLLRQLHGQGFTLLSVARKQ